MKYLVEMPVSPDAGKAIEARPGGPGPIIGRMIERFKPEAVYLATTRRVIYMIVDLDDEASMLELTIAHADLAGAYPSFTPLVTADAFPAVIGAATRGADFINQ